MGSKNGLRLYSDVSVEDIKWLWYPYIPYGKITLVQGDPGSGKSTFVINLIASLTMGRQPYSNKPLPTPKKVIYQCSEDGISDTIKPRLIRAGADCSMVAFIEEGESLLTLNDERILEAIIEFKVDVVVIDPIQAYIENDSDLMVAGKTRKLMRKLGAWAATYNCAIILVGHMNKKEGSKDLYRGMGSIDMVAAARSVLHIEVEDEVRIVHQIKNSLAQKGQDVQYQIGADNWFHWIKAEDNDLDKSNIYINEDNFNKHDSIINIMINELKTGDKRAEEMSTLFSNLGFTERTVKRAKREIGVNSYRKAGHWYWTLKDERINTNG